MIRSAITTACLLAAALSLGACNDEPLPRDLGFAPRSLDGTDLDGAFHYDREGNFMFDGDAQRAFDYFLTTEGELDADELYLWADAMIVAAVPPAQRAAVTESWHAYVSYRAEAAAALDAEAGQAAPQAIEELLDTLARDGTLAGTPFAEAERARFERALAIHELQLASRSGELAPAQRDAALAQLDAPTAARFAQTHAGRFLAAREAVEQARSAGADSAQLHAARVEHYDRLSPGAAERLAQLDERRADWTARVAAFEQARASLRASSSDMDETQLSQALDTLAATRFAPHELRRLALAESR